MTIKNHSHNYQLINRLQSSKTKGA